jgi:hypothetical protein
MHTQGRYTHFMLVLGLPLGVLAMVVATAVFAIQSSRVTDNQNQAIQKVLCFFEARNDANPVLTAKQKTAGIRLLNEALAVIHEGGCRL